MRYFLIVGEASADLHASRLISMLRARDPEASFAFMGGDLMAEASGVAPIIHYRDVAFMGIMPVLRHLGAIRRAGLLVQEELRHFRPDVVIPVDFAGFNFRYILPFVSREVGCPIYYYIAPKLWAWKQWRIHKLRRYVDALLCILPFEQEYFLARGIKALYVGNPCVDATLEARENVPSAKLQIALLAGSRRQELASNLAIMLEATKPYADRYRIVVSGAPGLTEADYTPYLSDYPDLELRFGDTYGLVQESRVALVTSGTATLETALLGTPQIVLYRMGGQRVARWIFDHFFSTPYISLVNLILNRRAVPELIGSEVSVSEVDRHLLPLLEDTPERKDQLASVDELRSILGTERTSLLAAEAIHTILANKS